MSSNPWDTPCDTLRVCRTGLGALSALPRSGGGALEPVAAIPIMSGAGASGAAGFACTAGVVPPLSTRGAAAALAAAGFLLAADKVEPEGFAELDAAASSEAESVSSAACPFAGTESGCEFDTDTEVAGTAVEVGIAVSGFALLGFAACGTATGAGADGVWIVTG